YKGYPRRSLPSWPGDECPNRVRFRRRDGRSQTAAPPPTAERAGHRRAASSRTLCLSQPLDFFRPVDCHAKVGHQAVGERINPTGDTGWLSRPSGARQNDISRVFPHLRDDVKLPQAVEAGPWPRDRIKFVAVLMEAPADRLAPRVYEPVPLAAHSRPPSAT